MKLQENLAALRGQRLHKLWLHPVLWIGLALLMGLVIGQQYQIVNVRIVKLAVAAAFALTILRFPTYVSIGLFLVLWTTPTAIALGNTNFVFLAFLLVSWIIKSAMRIEPGPRRTPLDWAILAYLLAHLLSIMHVDSLDTLYATLDKLRNLLWPIVLFYMITTLGRSQRRLLFLVQMLTIGMVWVCFTAFMEQFFPNVRYMPEWYLSVARAEYMFVELGGRAGGIFRSHGMLSDTAAVTAIVQLYLALHYRHRPWLRVYHWGVAFLCVYTIPLTGNRGGLILLIAGLLYFLLVFHKELSPKRILFAFLALAMLIQIGEMTATYAVDPALLARMVQTRFERGIPDTRQVVWSHVWGLVTEKPILGHGPHFHVTSGPLSQRILWPHNAYLFYFYTTGIVGMSAFLFLCWRVMRKTWMGIGLQVHKISCAQGLAATFHIAIAQFLLGQMRTDHQRGDVFAYFMWILFSLGILARQIYVRERRERPAIKVQVPLVSLPVTALKPEQRGPLSDP